MKRLLLIIPLLWLGGCAGINDHHASYLRSKCVISGFERDTVAFSQCYEEESSLWWDQVKDHQF